MFIRKESLREFIRLYPCVTGILCLNAALFFAISLPIFPKGIILEHTIGINLYIREGELWRLLTPIFIHSNATHFIFNTFTILILGPAVEVMLKPFRFLLLYFVSGVGANTVTYLIKPLTYSHLGASSSIFGLFGFYLFLLAAKKHVMTKQDASMIKALTALALFMPIFQANVNLTAHFAGCAIGFAMAFLYSYSNKNLFHQW